MVHAYYTRLTTSSRNIMRDIMLVNPSGLQGHAMGIDMNIEHLIGYLKVCIFSISRLLLTALSQGFICCKGNLCRLGSSWEYLSGSQLPSAHQEARDEELGDQLPGFNTQEYPSSRSCDTYC